MNILTRILEPTPRFFRVLRNAGLALTAASSALLAAPVSLPGILVSIAGYLLVGGSVLTAVSQLTTDGTSLPEAPALPSARLPASPASGREKGKGKGKKTGSTLQQ